jgi:hypothetical protein
MPNEKDYELRLFVAGMTPKCLAAFSNLKKICEEHLEGRYSIPDHRSPGLPEISSGRPDSGHPHPGAQAPRAGAQDYRRPLQHRKGLGRAGLAGAGLKNGFQFSVFGFRFSETFIIFLQ